MFSRRLRSGLKSNVRSFIADTRGESMITYGVSLALVAIVSAVALADLSDLLGGQYRSMASRLGADLGEDAPIVLSPCSDLYASGVRTDGIYAAAMSDGSTGISVGCHFETSFGLAGGWTVAAHQLEAAPAASWGIGIAPGRVATTFYDTSFALAASQMPVHGNMAVGRRLADGTIQILDGVSEPYGPGDLEYTGADAGESLVASGVFYEIHRSSSGNYCDHDPESPDGLRDIPEWFDTLTFDLLTPVEEGAVGTCGVHVDRTWAFSPNHPTQSYRGYSYDGSKSLTDEPYAWVVLVR